jgi:two-component system phosphate regulon response regulator PhoB
LAIGANVSAVATAELRADALVMDLRSRGVTHGLRRLHLGPTEFHLLEIFMENRGCVISRAQLMSAIWGRAAPVHERTVDVHIARLRRVISTGATQSPIRTVRGYGYVFDIIDVV